MNTYERIDRDLSTGTSPSWARASSVPIRWRRSRVRPDMQADVALPGMLHAKMKRSNIAHARIRASTRARRWRSRESGRC